jgi:streptogramin lyase
MGLTDSNVSELSPSGETIGTYVVGSHPEGLAIDPAGNVWVVNKGNGTAGTASGDSNVTKLSPSGATIGTFAVGIYPEIVAVDSGGNIWVANGYNRGITTGPASSSVTELNSSGAIIASYATGNQPYGIAIDKSGNVWVTNFGDGTPGTAVTNSNIQVYRGAAKGPQYFPYAGPLWPGAE